MRMVEDHCIDEFGVAVDNLICCSCCSNRDDLVFHIFFHFLSIVKKIILRHDEKDIKKEKRSMRQERILFYLSPLSHRCTFIPNK